jgi:hypothetical protein
MRTLYIVRGLPGSGKSTYAHTLPVDVVYEADQYFMDGDEYKFDPRKLKDAHEWCLNVTNLALRQGRSVAVANTFTTVWEIQNYVKMVRLLDQEIGQNINIVIVTCTGDYGNVHGVPDASIERMRNRFASQLTLAAEFPDARLVVVGE